jgi:uncharacterized protein YcbK (DUF882 family)
LAAAEGGGTDLEAYSGVSLTAMSARSHTSSPLRSRAWSLIAIALPATIGFGLAVAAPKLLRRHDSATTPIALAQAGGATTPDAAAPAAAASAPVTIEPLASPARLVHVKSINTREEATFRVGPRGFVPAAEVAAVEAFFRCRRTGQQHTIAPGVLVLLADIADRWPGHVIEVVSGYRAAPYGAPHSRHFSGHAIDLRVRGVRTSAVRDFVWREHESIGVGHYAEGNFVHVDWRPEDQEIAWSSPNEDSLPQYNPAWAKRARRGLHRAHAPGALAELASAPRAAALR